MTTISSSGRPRSRARRSLSTAVAVLIAAVSVLASTAPANAATTTAWAGFAPLTGTGGDFETELTFGTAPGLTASVTSTSRAGQVGVISGASTWLGEGTSIGAKYGTSRNQPYLNLRPRADTATTPSVTTYTFASPTPSSGWAFALGDIDADAVRVTAVTAAGTSATADELGYRESFNYCAPGLAGKPSCTGDALDVPTWDPGTTTLTGNAAAADTAGAAAWFEPNVALESLSFTFTRRSGFPVYQTWFASLARDIGGSVTEPGGAPVESASLVLVDENGTVVGTTTTLADGSYAFPGFTAADGYTVALDRPDGRVIVGPAERTADIADADALDVDFVVRDLVPSAVSGSVVDTDGTPLPGVPVTITGTDGSTQTTTTGGNGSYLFDTLQPQDYAVTIGDVPGYVVDTPAPPVTVPEDSETPITGIDVILAVLPSLSGTVSVAGEPAGGVTVTATGPGGTITTVTAADGTYDVPGLADGDYTITAIAPDGTVPVGSPTRSETIEGADVGSVDFAFARTGTVGGVVTDTDGAPIAGATVTVTGDGGSVVLTTDADGAYGLGGLPAGSYAITLTVPAGYTAPSDVSRSVVITTLGESLAEEDFVLEAEAVDPGPGPGPVVPDPGDPDPGIPAPGPGDEAPAPGDGLAVTGADNLLPLIAFGSATVLLGALAIVIAARRHRQR